jgi:preprotein translocase SecE subunit
MRRVAWPTRDEVFHNSGVYLLTVVAIAVLIALADVAIQAVLSPLLGF